MKKTAIKTAAASAKPAAASAKAKAPAKKTAAKPTRKKTGAASEPPATFISAKIDIGFGNHLYVRGEGPGLSWDRGIAMDCVGNGLWTIAVRNANIPVTFKVLVNDLSWCSGEDFVVDPGQSVTVTPAF